MKASRLFSSIILLFLVNTGFSQTSKEYFECGIANYNNQDFKSAIDDFTNVIQINPMDVVAFHWRGIAKCALKEYNESIVDFNMALEIDPINVASYFLRGNAENNLKDYNSAILDFNNCNCSGTLFLIKSAQNKNC
jgi:tetratricopeptide (TPR) repeat protein